MLKKLWTALNLNSFELLSRPHVLPLRSALVLRDHTGNSGSEHWELCSQGGLQQPQPHGERGRMFIPITTVSPAVVMHPTFHLIYKHFWILICSSCSFFSQFVAPKKPKPLPNLKTRMNYKVIIKPKFIFSVSELICYMLF